MKHVGWLLYGANGYTGRLIAEEAVARGLRPVLGGRDAKSVGALAAKLGLEHVVFSLEDDVERWIAPFAAVVLAAGPFSATSERMVDACLHAGVHYVDVNGDIAVFERIFEKAKAAERKGRVLLSGAGFDVVPTDCVAAALKEAMPDATHLELAWGGDLEPSRGTSKASLEILPRGGAIRRDGAIETVPTGWKTKTVPFANGPALAVTVPWGDVATAYRSTGIPNIVVYSAMPPLAIHAMRFLRPFFSLLRVGAVRRWLGKIVEWTISGPDARALSEGRTFIWGRVTNAHGEERTATLTGPDGYRLTALAAVEALRRVLDGEVAPGAHTPATAFGPGFVDAIPGCEGIVLSPIAEASGERPKLAA